MNTKSVLHKFLQHEQEQPSQDDAPQDGLEEASDGRYRAVAYGKQGRSRELMLRFVFPDNRIALMSYSYLTSILCRSHQYISLIFTDCVITLSGRNLTPLLDPLQDGKVKTIYCFHPQKYPAPDPSEPIIYQMEREGLREVIEAREG